MKSRYIIEETNFIFKPNLAGEFRKEDRYPSNTRACNIIIPDPEQAQEMIDDGLNVRQTTPSENYKENYEPEYFVKAYLKFASEGSRSNPIINLIDQEGYSTPLDEHTVGCIDNIRIKRDSVRVVLAPYSGGGGAYPTLYIQTLYVEQDLDNDPWYGKFPRRPRND